jgi:hypothetical protein
MNPPRKFRQEQRTHKETAHEQELTSQQQQQYKEFATVDELLREDAKQVAVPPAVEARVREAVRKEPPQKGWWQRVFGA